MRDAFAEQSVLDGPNSTFADKQTNDHIIDVSQSTYNKCTPARRQRYSNLPRELTGIYRSKSQNQRCRQMETKKLTEISFNRANARARRSISVKKSRQCVAAACTGRRADQRRGGDITKEIATKAVVVQPA